MQSVFVDETQTFLQSECSTAWGGQDSMLHTALWLWRTLEFLQLEE